MADKKVKNKSVLKKVFSYIGKYKYYLILSMLFAAVTVGLTLYAPILVGHAIDCIVGKDNVDFDLMKSITFNSFLSFSDSTSKTLHSSQWLKECLP